MQNSINRASRIVEFDILKAIGIILVVIGHSGISGMPYTLIYAFHMPLFFFVSGFFFKPVKLSCEIKKKSKTLIVPWLFFASLLSIVEIVVNWIGTGSMSSSVSNYFSDFDLLNENCRFLYKSIWFLVCLFEIDVLYTILINGVGEKLSWGVVLCMYITAWLLHHYHINIPLFVDSMLGCIIYFHLGYAFRKYDFWKRQMNFYSALISLICLVLIIILLRPVVECKNNVFPIYLPSIAVPFIIVLYFICKYVLSKDAPFKLLNIVGQDSLLIMGLQAVFYNILAQLDLGISGLMLCCTRFILVMVAVSIARLPIIKFVPRLIGKKVNDEN